MLLDSLRDQWTRIIQLDEEIRKIELRLKQCLRESSDRQKIAEIPGIGLLTATAAVASLGNATTFHSGRQFAAWLELIPRQTSTGGRVRQLGLSKRGDTYLRTLLMHGVRSILNRGYRSEWVERLLTTRPYTWRSPQWLTSSPEPFGPCCRRVRHIGPNSLQHVPRGIGSSNR